MTSVLNCDIENAKLSFDDREENYVTVEEASEILGLQKSQTRALLGEPDRVWESAAGRIQYIFHRARVLSIKQKREDRRIKRQIEAGLRSCYFCKTKYHKEELCGGLCPHCQARKFIKNFACHGDCYRRCFDAERLKVLETAIAELNKEKSPER